jgi:hypothetical protein
MSEDAQLLQLVISATRSGIRFFFIALTCFIVLLSLGVGFGKSMLGALAACFLSVMGQVSRKTIEALAAWSAILIVINWTGLLPLSEWSRAIIAIVGRTLG